MTFPLPTDGYPFVRRRRSLWRRLGPVGGMIVVLVGILVLVTAWALLNGRQPMAPRTVAPAIGADGAGAAGTPQAAPPYTTFSPDPPPIPEPAGGNGTPAASASGTAAAPATPAAPMSAPTSPPAASGSGPATAGVITPAPATAPAMAPTTDVPEPSTAALPPPWKVAADNELKASLTATCNRLTGGRYPMVRASRSDMSLADFSTVFGPGGLIDAFFQKHLAAHVDRTARPWRWRPDESLPASIAADGLPAFQRAAEIRRVMFSDGPGSPAVHLDMKPVDLDAGLRSVDFDIDGTALRFGPSNKKAGTIGWPDPGGAHEVTLSSASIDSGTSGGVPQATFAGPWGLFRLFDRAEVTDFTDPPDRFRAVFDIGGRQAMFDVTTSAPRNPFRLPELAAFRCPSQL